jgi:hypothetical protein
MKKGSKKLNAMLLIVCMIVTAFAVVSLPVVADENINVDLAIDYVGAWMEPPTDDSIFNIRSDTGTPFYFGDTDAELTIRIVNRDGANPVFGVDVTLEIVSSIITDIPQNTDPGAPYDILAGGSQDYEFLIDIGTSETPGYFDLRFDIDYEKPLANPLDEDDVEIQIYISSIFDNTGTPDTHEDLPNILETDGGNGYFEDFEEMQEGQITLTRFSGFTISDVRTDLDVSVTGQNIDVSGGQNIALNPSPGGTFIVLYRLDVGMPPPTPRQVVVPGIYTGDLEIQYVRDDTGETITEQARDIDLTVDYTPRVTVMLESALTLNQGDLTADFNVRFYNEGNVDLSRLWIWSDEPDPAGDWWDLTFHHYENDDDTYGPQVEIGDLNRGSYSSYIPTTVAADPRAPNGTHRLPFQWNAWYYEDGSTGDATRWVEVGGFMWNNDMMTRTPMVGRLYEDGNEDMSYDAGEAIEDVWTGAYVDIVVLDDNGVTMEAFIATSLNAGFFGDITYTTITVELYNMELVTYNDLECRLRVGSGQPFLNPADHTAQYLENDPLMSTTIGPWPATLDIPFTVDINVAWWQSNSLTPGVYMVDMMVDGTNDDEEVRYSDNLVPVRVSIDGFGPELFATMVNYEEIKPGETFTLSISIKNFGDDTAREVDAYLRADFVSGWTILDQFTTSIGSYAGEGDAPVGDASWGWVTDFSTYTSFNRSHDIRPAEIGVDNVPQIVELYDWISRRETPPQGVILWIHLNRLGPGENQTFVFEMVSDVNMVEGMAYYETLELYYVDAIEGDTYGPHGPPFETHYTPPQEVLIRAGKGEKYTGEEDFDYTFVLYALILYALGGRGGGRESKSEEPYEPYTEDYNYEPPEEEPMPEEDLGPPEPEEKPPEEEKPLE